MNLKNHPQEMFKSADFCTTQKYKIVYKHILIKNKTPLKFLCLNDTTNKFTRQTKYFIFFNTLMKSWKQIFLSIKIFKIMDFVLLSFNIPIIIINKGTPIKNEKNLFTQN